MTNQFRPFWQGLLCAALLVSVANAKTPTLSAHSPQHDLYSALDEGGFTLEMTGSQQAFADNRMMYTVSFRNTGYKASGDIDITSPVPPDTVYIPDTANGENCDILFSVDGGDSWGQAGQLEVQQADGSWRQANAKDYTHIKWLYLPELRPAEVQRVSFQVVME